MSDLDFDVEPAGIASDASETSLWNRTVCNDDEEYTRDLTFFYNQSISIVDKVSVEQDDTDVFANNQLSLSVPANSFTDDLEEAAGSNAP